MTIPKTTVYYSLEDSRKEADADISKSTISIAMVTVARNGKALRRDPNGMRLYKNRGGGGVRGNQAHQRRQGGFDGRGSAVCQPCWPSARLASERPLR